MIAPLTVIERGHFQIPSPGSAVLGSAQVNDQGDKGRWNPSCTLLTEPHTLAWDCVLISKPPPTGSPVGVFSYGHKGIEGTPPP